MQFDRVWIAPAHADADRMVELIGRARRRGFHRFVLPAEVPFEAEPGEEVAKRSADRFEVGGASGPRTVIPIRLVRGPGELEEVIRGASGAAGVAVEWVGERLIPLENLLAAVHRTTQVWVVGATPSDAGRFLGALERGADAVVVEVHELADLETLEHGLDAPRPASLGWELVKVTRVAPAGMGDRVLVDTTSLLGPDEGALVGSSAAFLLHVRSEAAGSRYTRPRPFRVNAGPAHSYALLADGSTRYLSELAPADELLVCVAGAGSRGARVGRLKVERRPLLLIEVARGDRRFTVFVQDAETVRLSSQEGAMAATDVGPGVRLWGAALPPGRHLGQSVDESVVER